MTNVFNKGIMVFTKAPALGLECMERIPATEVINDPSSCDAPRDMSQDDGECGYGFDDLIQDFERSNGVIVFVSSHASALPNISLNLFCKAGRSFGNDEAACACVEQLSLFVCNWIRGNPRNSDGSQS